MGIVVGRYISKPRPNPNDKPCEAIQLTADNIEQVAEWTRATIKPIDFADGTVEQALDIETYRGRYRNPERETAYLGRWVVKTEDGFLVRTEESFDYCYMPAPETDPNMLFLKSIGEDMFNHIAVRDAIAKAMVSAFNTGRKVTDLTDARIRLEMGAAVQIATAEIEKIYRRKAGQD